MKFLFLSASALLIQPILSFCVYNNLENNGHLKIEFTNIDVPSEKWFRANLNPGEKQCCNYSNRDCSPIGTNDYPTRFKATIAFEERAVGTDYTVTCTSGGGLTFHGTLGKVGATCTKADGTVEQL